MEKIGGSMARWGFSEKYFRVAVLLLSWIGVATTMLNNFSCAYIYEICMGVVDGNYDGI
jgi:hypothetical protein